MFLRKDTDLFLFIYSPNDKMRFGRINQKQVYDLSLRSPFVIFAFRINEIIHLIKE